MTVQALPWSIQGQSHPAEVARNHTAAILGAPVAAFTNAVAATSANGAHGVMDGLNVVQNGTPNMSVNVAAGRAFIRSGNASSIAAGVYAVMNDATVNVAISPSDPTNPRIDLVVIQVRDTNYGEAANDVRLTVVTGTPAAVPSAPALTSYPNALVLAEVAVAAAATTIVNANITDRRTYATALGGIHRCTSTTRPTNPYDGMVCHEINTDFFIRWDGANWRYTLASGTYTPTLSGMAIGTGGGAANTATWYYDGNMLDVVGQIVFGTTGPTFPGAGGNINVALPTSPAWTIPVLNGNHPAGLVTLSPAGSNWVGFGWVNTGTTIRFLAESINAAAAGTDYVKQAATGAAIPAAWAAGNTIQYSFRVPATAVA